MTDYSEDKKVDGLADVSDAVTSATRILCQDMDDTDKIGVSTPDKIFQAGAGNNIFCRPLYLNIAKIAINSKPSLDILGVTAGYSFPIYASDDEELYFSSFVPCFWDGESDLTVRIRCHLQEANTDKKFKFELCWDHLVIGDVVGTSCNAVYTEVDTGTAEQYKSFQMEFAIDYDIDGVGNEIKTGERLVMRLRRVAASADEITGEVVVAPPCLTGYRYIL